MVSAMNLTEFATRQLASAAAASFLAGQLEAKLKAVDQAVALVSGGSSPVDCFEQLSSMPLDWGRVTIMPTDERLVPVDHPDSNQGMIGRCLQRNLAKQVQVSPLSWEQLPAGSLACSLVGMGEDGHFASIFPDNPALSSLLAVDAAPGTAEVQTAASEHRRLTANLALLLLADSVLLLVFGEAKKALLQAPANLPITSPRSLSGAEGRSLSGAEGRSLSGAEGRSLSGAEGNGNELQAPANLPIASLLAQNVRPVQIYWAP